MILVLHSDRCFVRGQSTVEAKMLQEILFFVMYFCVAQINRRVKTPAEG